MGQKHVRRSKRGSEMSEQVQPAASGILKLDKSAEQVIREARGHCDEKDAQIAALAAERDALENQILDTRSGEMRLLILLGSIPLAVGAYFFGRALPDEGVMLIVGILFGVILSVPAALFLLWRMIRSQIIVHDKYADRVWDEIEEPVWQVDSVPTERTGRNGNAQ